MQLNSAVNSAREKFAIFRSQFINMYRLSWKPVRSRDSILLSYLQSVRFCVCLCVRLAGYVCLCICLCVCLRVSVFACLRVCMSLCRSVCLCVSVCPCACLLVCVSAYCKGGNFRWAKFSRFSVGDHFAGQNFRGLGLRAKSRGYFTCQADARHASEVAEESEGGREKTSCGQVDCVYDAVTTVKYCTTVVPRAHQDKR